MIPYIVNKIQYSVGELMAFEDEVAQRFNEGKIRAPIHLSNGGENELIEIFKNIQTDDFVFTTWRSHYHALLKGVPKELIMEEIMAGNSISLNFPKYNFYSSAIACTHVPVAVGVSQGIKIKGFVNSVWCFVGDMTAESGIANSSFKYSYNQNLPITFVIEDNNLSVCSNTREVWNNQKLFFEHDLFGNVRTYKYSSKYPHAGAGVRVQF